MFNPIKPNRPIQPSINTLALLGPRAMKVIDRHKSIAAIAAYEQTLGPKVVLFKEVRSELMMLVGTNKKLAIEGAAEIAELDGSTRVWSAHLQNGTSLDSEEVGITNTRTSEGIFDNALGVMDTLRNHEELPFAAQALSELEDEYSTAKATYDALQTGRVAVQAKQRELQAIAAAVQKELVKLRTVVRIVLGTSHLDYQRLRLRVARVPDAEDERPPEPAESSPESG
jgi:hypothetical protein